MLGQKLSKRKWLSLIALFVGVTVVQSDNHKSDSDAPHPETGLGYQTLGFLAVVAAAFTSGFCGVYQQRILQSSKTNMWVRNAQMGVTSVALRAGRTRRPRSLHLGPRSRDTGVVSRRSL